MENSPNIKINPMIASAVVVQIIFMVLATISLVNILNNNEPVIAKVSVDDYSAVNTTKTSSESSSKTPPMIDDTKKSVIESELFDTVALNLSDTQNIQNFGAKIREGSVVNTYLNEAKAYLLNFIVDLPDLQQSYRIVYRWADSYPNKFVPSNYPVAAFCLASRDLIYGDFNCQDDYSGLGDDQVVQSLLENHTFSNFTVGILGDAYDGEPLSLSINTISEDQSVKSAAVAEISDYLRPLGFNLDDYEYTISSYQCCGLD